MTTSRQTDTALKWRDTNFTPEQISDVEAAIDALFDKLHENGFETAGDDRAVDLAGAVYHFLMTGD